MRVLRKFGLEFRDDLSRKEYNISGLCQHCQDAFFGVEESEELGGVQLTEPSVEGSSSVGRPTWASGGIGLLHVTRDSARTIEELKGLGI